MDGFKCYAEKTSLKNIDKSFTAITGMNGSGKSNIIDAIIFTLDLSTSKYMRVASLKELINIHRKDCTVVLIFDNTEKNSSPSGFETYETIEISRSLDNEGKSKYRMNGHSCTKNTIENLCKSVGVANEFIVMQGHITKILNMKTHELKNMIEETSGTRSYSLEREKSLELLEKKELKLREAQDHLKKTISPFFEQLKKEKKIYEENKDLEKNRKFHMEQLEKLELLCKKDDFFSKRLELENNLSEYSTNFYDLKEVEEKLKEVENYEEIDLFELKTQIENEKNRIEKIKPVISEDKSDKEKDLQILETSLKERRFNKKELMEKEKILSQELLNNFSDKIFELERSREAYSKKELEFDIIKMEISRNNVSGIACFKSEEEIAQKTQKLGVLEHEYSILKNKITYPILEGTYIDQNNILCNYADGIYGTVDENFEFKDLKYKEAVITILGSRAKFVICKNDIVATELLKVADRRISCIPLNKIVVSDARIQNTGKGIKAIETIKFDSSLEKAFHHIFNGFYIFEDKNEANRFCFKNKVICATLDGTIYDYKGTLTGGRVSYKFEVFRMKDILKLENEIHSLKSSIPNIEEITKIKDYNSLISRKIKLEEELGTLRGKCELLDRLCSSKSTIDISELKRELEDTRKLLVEAAKEEKAYSDNLNRYNKLMESVREDKTNQEINSKALAKSLKRLAELQDYLRMVEIKENNRRVSLRMIESLDFKKSALVKSTVRLRSKIIKIYQDITNEVSNDSLFQGLTNENLTNVSTQHFTVLDQSVDYSVLFKEFGIDSKIFNDSSQPMKTDERFRIEECIREHKEKISAKRVPSNFELLEKNAIDIQMLEEKIIKLQKDKLEIISSMEKLTEMDVKENKKAFEHVNNTLRKFLGYFLPSSDILITEEYEIKVKVGNWKNSLSELSGGQRSLIALCLIFSMLSFKPAPFYIFDEIDAALDLNYTQSIGEIIKNEFHGGQFIIVSLKNNMFDNANRIFKVFIQDHKSKICQIK